MKYLSLKIILFFCLLPVANAATVSYEEKSRRAFSSENELALVLKVEAALARSQAKYGVIPQWAADDITNKSTLEFLPLADFLVENNKVRHRMVALLNVWNRSLKEAGQYVHFGATTVDIYDTVMTLQLIDSIDLNLIALRALEASLMQLAVEHKNTVMIGRTLGQQALPITFGKKVSTWVAETRRNIERFKGVRNKLKKMSILKGAVGSYVGLGSSAIEVEKQFAKELGLSDPYIDDWHSARDVYAEYALAQALVAQSLSRLGQEVYLLQMNEVNELTERRPKKAVGSSTMPHKVNPSDSDALIYYGRTIRNKSGIILEDVVNFFERDNTSRTKQAIKEINYDFSKLMDASHRLIKNLDVNSNQMAKNLTLSKGWVLSQRLVLAMADKMGKTNANERLHSLAKRFHKDGISLSKAVKEDAVLKDVFSEQELAELLNPKTYLGLASTQVDEIVKMSRIARTKNQSTLTVKSSN